MDATNRCPTRNISRRCYASQGKSIICCQRLCSTTATIWAVSTVKLGRFNSEYLSSGLALPRRRDRPVVGTHDVTRWHSRPGTQWTRFFHRALCVEHYPCRQRPVETIGRTVVVHEVQRDLVFEGILSNPSWVEHRWIGLVLFDHAHTWARNHSCQKHHATRRPAFGNQRPVHTAGGVW